MVKRIVFVAVLIVAAMVAVKNGSVLRAAGMIGHCAVVQTSSDGQQWEACSSGKLEGAPDLSRNGCTSAGLFAGQIYWRCPAPVVSSP